MSRSHPTIQRCRGETHIVPAPLGQAQVGPTAQGLAWFLNPITILEGSFQLSPCQLHSLRRLNTKWESSSYWAEEFLPPTPKKKKKEKKKKKKKKKLLDLGQNT